MNYSDFQDSNITKKVDFLSIGLADSVTPVPVKIGNAEVQVFTKLPKEKFVEAIDWAALRIIGSGNYISPVVRDGMIEFAILRYYTNLDVDTIISDVSGKTDLYEILDILDAVGGYKLILSKIDAEQLKDFTYTVDRTCDAIMAHRNSAAGIIETLAQDADAQAKIFDQAAKAMQSADVKDLVDTVKAVNNVSNGEILKIKETQK